MTFALSLGFAYLPVYVGVNSFLYRRLFRSSGIDERLTQIFAGLTAGVSTNAAKFLKHYAYKTLHLRTQMYIYRYAQKT